MTDKNPATIVCRLGKSCELVFHPIFLLACLVLGALLAPTAIDSEQAAQISPFAPSVLAASCLAVFGVFFFHECGHALFLIARGHEVRVSFTGMLSATATRARPSREDEWRSLLAGPMANVAVGIACLGIREAIAPMESGGALDVLTVQMARLNLAFGIIGLVPVVPMDAGLALLNLLPPQHHKKLFGFGFALSCLGALVLLVNGSLLGALLLGLIAARNHRLSQFNLKEVVDNLQAAKGQIEQLEEGWNALRRGDVAEAERLGTITLKAAQRSEVAMRALDLLAWVDLARADAPAAWKKIEQGRAMSRGYARALTEALALEAMKRPQEALAKARVAIELEPSLTTAQLLLRLLLSQKAFDEARRLVESHPWPARKNRQAQLAEVAMAEGLPEQAAALWQKAFEETRDCGQALEAARVLARGGHSQGALELLERVRESGGEALEQIAQLSGDEAFSALRGTERFEAVVRREERSEAS